MKITFINAKRVNLDRDGIDFQYFYQIDNNIASIHKIHVVCNLGAEISWIMNLQEVNEYSKKVFTVIKDFFVENWNDLKKLPDEEEEYIIQEEFHRTDKEKTDWKNYILELV